MLEVVVLRQSHRYCFLMLVLVVLRHFDIALRYLTSLLSNAGDGCLTSSTSILLSNAGNGSVTSATSILLSNAGDGSLSQLLRYCFLMLVMVVLRHPL